MRFFESRYNYLEDIEKAISNMVNEHCAKAKSTKIVKSNNTLEQLQILKKENIERLNNDYYDGTIEHIQNFFETEFSDPLNLEVVKKFEDVMLKGIKELYDKISEMKIDDLQVDDFLHPKHSKEHFFGSSYSKLNEYALGYSDKRPFTLQEVTKPPEGYV